MPSLSKDTVQFNYKMVVLGYYSVGKSSLIMKYVKGEFNPNEESTIGAAFLTKTTESKGDIIKYEIWDTAGQERYNSLIPMYYRGAHVALIVYDVSSKESFATAKKWTEELINEKPKDFLKVLIGNKIDLDESQRKVTFDEGSEYALEKNMMFYETSAKTGHNVNKLFSEIADILPRKQTGPKTPVISLEKGKNRFTCC